MTQSSIIDTISPEFCGILWLTNGPIGEELVYFKEIDYLLNGLLIQFFFNANGSGHHPKSFFIGESFGKSFSVGHIDISTEMPSEQIKSLLQFFEQREEDNKVLILQENSDQTSLAKIQKFFPQFEFVLFQ